MNTLRDEIQKTVNWFADVDLQMHGYVTQSTKEIARVQKCEIEPSLKVCQFCGMMGKAETICDSEISNCLTIPG